MFERPSHQNSQNNLFHKKEVHLDHTVLTYKPSMGSGSDGGGRETVLETVVEMAVQTAVEMAVEMAVETVAEAVVKTAADTAPETATEMLLEMWAEAGMGTRHGD